MPRANTTTRLDRLEKLSALLADGTAHAAADLAAQLSISLRTVCRDIDLLRERGWAITGEAGRGGGVALANRWPVRVSILREQEAIDLLLALAASEAMGFTITQQLTSVRESIARSFAPADRTAIARLRQRIRVAAPSSLASGATLAAFDSPAADRVKAAFFKRQRLRIDYRDGSDKVSQREIEPQCLLCAWPLWYVLAWDVAKQDVRTFRIDRIQHVQPLDVTFSLKPPATFWQACNDEGLRL